MEHGFLGNYPGLSEGAPCSHKGPYKEKKETLGVGGIVLQKRNPKIINMGV